jgi:hypothetical protein
MKKRLHDKKAGIAILLSLIVISLAEVVLRSVILKDDMFNLFNAGEPMITALFSLMLIIIACKGKDRVFYIVSGAWLGYFVLKQIFDLPAMISTFFAAMNNSEGFTDYAILLHIFSMVCIFAIGVLLVEYMNDGTIYNKAFNVLCVITVLTLAVNVAFAIYDIVVLKDTVAVLAIFNNLSRGAMLFLFTFFAYDSAKAQLDKTNLKK